MLFRSSRSLQQGGNAVFQVAGTLTEKAKTVAARLLEANDADVVLDARFLPNPHWVDELRPLSGLDGPVNDFVLEQPQAREFLDRATALLDLMSIGYLQEGKRYVTIAIGCTGGKHRSVSLAENLAARLVRQGVETLVVHRDLGRE